MAGVISGRLSHVKVGANDLAGAMSFSHSGGIRRVVEAPETFDADYIEKIPGMLEGGEIEVTGVITDIDDTAWIALIAAFHAGTTYANTEIKFYVNATDYLEPDATEGFLPASHVFLTKCPDAIVHEAAGVAQISLTFAICGQMILTQP